MLGKRITAHVLAAALAVTPLYGLEDFEAVLVPVFPDLPLVYRWATIADLEGDGLNEVVVVDSTADIVRILHVAGDGSFVLVDEIVLPSIPFPPLAYVSPEIADFDGDGRQDIAVLERGNGLQPAVHILLNQIAGFTQTRYPLAGLDAGYNLAVADFDDDGRPDVATCDLGFSAPARTFIHWSSGSPGALFSPAASTTLDMNGSWAVMVYAGDADDDGDLDLAATSAQGGPAITARVFLNQGGRIFGHTDLQTVGPRSTHLAFGDVTGDGTADIVTDSHYPHTDGQLLQLYQGIPGGFAAPIHYTGGDLRPYGPVLGDLDDDGNADVVFDRTGQMEIGVLRGAAGGPLPTVEVAADPILAVDHGFGTNVDTLSVGDVDSDGDLDILFSFGRTVLLRQGPIATPPCGQPGAGECTLTLVASQDSFVRKGAPDTNEGGNDQLRIQSSGKNRVLVGFDLSGVQMDDLVSATLELAISDLTDNWGPAGRAVSAHRLLAPWSEGDGWTVGGNTRGSGAGVTWTCATDSAIENQSPNCALDWDGGDFAAATGAAVVITNGLTGSVSWDVTQDVLAGAGFGWLVAKDQESQTGKVHFMSRQGAAIAEDEALAPRLILEFD